MKTNTQIIAALMFLFAGYHASMAQSEICLGDCRGVILRNTQDISINRVYAHEFIVRAVPYTELRIDNRYPLFPAIKGQHGNKIKSFFDLLSKQGYHTVNVANFINGGWFIQGNKRTFRKQRAQQNLPLQPRNDQTPRTQKKVNNDASDSKRETSLPSEQSRGKNCRVRLYSDLSMFSGGDYRLESYINLKGEFLNVTWGNTVVNQGEPYEIDAYIENRSGNKRTLKNGKNWVDPGRYRVFLKYSGIRSTSVTIEYYGDCE